MYNARELAKGRVQKVPHSRRPLTESEQKRIDTYITPSQMVDHAFSEMLALSKKCRDVSDHPDSREMVQLSFEDVAGDVVYVQVYFHAQPPLLKYGFSSWDDSRPDKHVEVSLYVAQEVPLMRSRPEIYLSSVDAEGEPYWLV